MDLGVLAAQALRVGSGAEARAGVERLAIGIRLALPLVEAGAAASGAVAELARDLRALARTRDVVSLVLPAGRVNDAVPARIDLGDRLVALPPALRDALLAALASPGPTSAAGAPAVPTAPTTAAATSADAAARAWMIGAQTSAAPAIALGASGIARGLTRDAQAESTAAAVSFRQPLIDRVEAVEPAQPISERLRQALTASGLFFESHLAQWTRGERSDAALRSEVLALLTTASATPGAAAGGAERVAAQMEAMQRQAVVLQGPAWPGQPVTITLAREPTAGDDEHAAGAVAADAHAVFTARITLDLPHLGPLSVQLRLAGSSVAVALEAAAPEFFAPHLSGLAEQLQAHGLQPASLQARMQGMAA